MQSLSPGGGSGGRCRSCLKTAKALGASVCQPNETCLEVSVTYDGARGYIASADSLRQPVVALSLNGLRRRIEALMMPDDVMVVLQLDRVALRERDRRRAAGSGNSLHGRV